MEYFKILNLVKEPFSNSPEPEFFYDSPQHVNCLQNLEMAIRLRRGLNVVIGDVGTGKTTLCRRLISKFDGDETIRTHLVLDPSFNDSLEFLCAVCKMLGVQSDSVLFETEWMMKEAIKNYLFEQGVSRERIIVLVIDEGQKIPGFCLEILREFLNYETNTYKLLQILIFAQKEFNTTLEDRTNFSDRINFFCELGPLNFTDTNAMIRHRIEKASLLGDSPIQFTYFALRAIYRATGGYPRRIVTLCHQIILTMIIQNRTKVTRALVNACVHRKLREMSRPFPWTRVAVLSGILLIVVVIGMNSNRAERAVLPDGHNSFKKQKENKNGSLKAADVQAHDNNVVLLSSDRDNRTKDQKAFQSRETEREQPLIIKEIPDTKKRDTIYSPGVAHADQQNNGENAIRRDLKKADFDENRIAAIHQVRPARNVGGKAKEAQAAMYPPSLGSLEVENGWIISRMIASVRGFCEIEYLQQVHIMNPHIGNLDQIKSGDVVVFPAMPVDATQWKQLCWIQVAEEQKLDEAHRMMHSYLDDSIPVRLVPHWTATRGFTFSIILKEGFINKESAREALKSLPSRITNEGCVIETWEDGTIFFSHCVKDIREG